MQYNLSTPLEISENYKNSIPIQTRRIHCGKVRKRVPRKCQSVKNVKVQCAKKTSERLHAQIS